MKVFIVNRVFSAPSFAGSVQIAVFDDKESADRYVQEAGAAFAHILECVIVKPTQGGAGQMVAPLKQFLGDIGIAKIGLAISELEIEGRVKCASPQRILIPN